MWRDTTKRFVEQCVCFVKDLSDLNILASFSQQTLTPAKISSTAQMVSVSVVICVQSSGFIVKLKNNHISCRTECPAN